MAAMPEVPVRPGMPPNVCGCGGWLSGAGDTDCTLPAEQMAAGSKDAVPVSTCVSVSIGGLIAGPMTFALVGMADGGTARWPGTGAGSRMSRMLRAWRSRAVSGFRPKVD